MRVLVTGGAGYIGSVVAQQLMEQPMALDAQVSQGFAQRYGAAPTFVVRAPGRVNLIGEHTDYNDGFVMPMAIDRVRSLSSALMPSRTSRKGPARRTSPEPERSPRSTSASPPRARA